MHAVKKKLCSRAFGGIQELQSFASQTIARRGFTGSSGAAVVKTSRRRAHVTEGMDVFGVNWNYDGVSSWVGGSDSILRKPILEAFVRMIGLRIGGVRQMGITARPGDRAAQHGVRNPLPYADGSPERMEEQRQDEFLRGSKRAAASKIIQVEEAVGGQGGASFEAADAELRPKLGMASADVVHETASEFTNRSESHSTGLRSGVDVPSGDDVSNSGIDEEVQRGLIADSEHPAGRVVEDDPNSSSSEDKKRGGNSSRKEAETYRTDDMQSLSPDKLYSTDPEDRTDKVHPYGADHFYSTDEALDKGQKQWEEGKAVHSGASKLVAEDDGKSEGDYGTLKPL